MAGETGPTRWVTHGPHKCLGLDGSGGRFDPHCSEFGGRHGHYARLDAVGYAICKACILNKDGVDYN